MSSHKAPSAGQKVHAHPAKNAPSTTEGVGSIKTGSLAAESIRSGGAFSSNPNADTKIGSGPTENPRASKPGTSGQAGASNPDSLANQKSYAGPAPSYIDAQRIAPEAWGAKSKGNDIKEGGFAGSGTNTEGKLPEPGSAQDPGRLAVQGMVEGEVGVGGGAGPRKKKAGGDEQPFGVLKETSAKTGQWE